MKLTRFAFAFLLSGTLLQAQTPAGPGVSVLSTSGQGEARVTPDRATVMVNIQTRATTAAAAAADNAQKSRAVLAALAALGLQQSQLSTLGYTVYPEMIYAKDGSNPRVAAYVVTNMVRAETKRPDQAGAIIDASLSAGANMINSLSFYASNIDEGRREAIAAAVASARADAEAMAKAAGGRLGVLLDLSTGGPTIPPRPMFDVSAKRSMMAEASPINPGEQVVTVFVTARWTFLQQ